MASEAEREKSVVVVVRRPPLGSERTAEALRVAVGQTLAPQRVAVVFIDDGVWAATQASMEAARAGALAKPIQTLMVLEHPLVADSESLRERGIGGVIPGVQVHSRNEVLGLIREADAVIVY